jgi:hypothetical protein
MDILSLHPIPVLLLEPSLAEGRPKGCPMVLVGLVFNRLWKGDWSGRVSRRVVTSHGGTSISARTENNLLTTNLVGIYA